MKKDGNDMHTMKRGSRSVQLTILAILMVNAAAWAQISPGELVEAHAHLEGIRNCTKCHTLGDKVSNDKCLDCHREIKSRVEQKKGYHASSEVAGKDCFSCHSDHHGRRFDIIRFDQRQFDHSLTGYKLTGAHLRQECSACHQDKHIESAEIRNKEYTFLGLRQECKSCHIDVHQNTLSVNCASCHTTESFAPAVLFDHDNTDFPLKGQHRQVECKDCHDTRFVNGAFMQRFSGISFTSCASCHEDVHDGQLGNRCTDCHNEESFQLISGKSAFNHNQTRFPLLGKHQRIDCRSCHQLENKSADRVFRDFQGKEIHQCTLCHTDVHDSKFGQDCKACHTEESFRQIIGIENFDHSLTGFTLEGKHQQVDCRQCHESSMVAPMPHSRCTDCHIDYHEGQFIRQNAAPDCRQCHTVAGFAGSTYTLDQHNVSVFPLTGSHLATPCFACHLKEEKWSFRNLGSECIDCHEDIHAGGLREKYYPQKACDQCHSPEGWASVTFNHNQTNFILEGRHNQVPCLGCHQQESDQNIPRISLLALETACYACHEEVHYKQFEIDGVTDCRRCHHPDAWTPSVFDHQTARFPLDGAHIKVACRDCHRSEMRDEQSVVVYRLDRFECADCHF